MFRLHEIVVGQNFVDSTHRNGMECEVIGELQERSGTFKHDSQIHTAIMYEIKWVDGDITLQPPQYLRKLPDGRTKTEWSGVFVPRELVDG